MITSFRIATRKSDLALWQANWVKAELAHLGYASELILIDTHGDQTQAANKAFSQMQGQGFFSKAVQDAILENKADIAVHSFKDLPSLGRAELEIAAVSKRADARDVLLIKPNAFQKDAEVFPLKNNAVIGTSAVRRQKQLNALRPDLRCQELRGNVPTRVRKLREGDLDAIVLAAAGLERLKLDLAGLERVILEPSVMVPAPAQGALALEIRRADYDLAAVLTNLHDIVSFKAVAAERGLMAMLQGGCQLALGAYAELSNGNISLKAWYEGHYVECDYPSSEGVAMLTFEALGRPTV